MHLLAAAGEAVGDFGRNCRFLIATDKSGFFQHTQALGQHFCGNGGNLLLQLAKAHRPVSDYEPQDIQRPWAAEQVKESVQRTAHGAVIANILEMMRARFFGH